MFGYNKNNQLVSTDLHRADTLNGVDSHEITLYEYDGRNLVTREVITASGLQYVRTSANI